MDGPLEPDQVASSPASSQAGPTLEIDQAATTEVESYLLDDVPLFHLPMVGATIITIAFRVGRADEPVPRGGMTHLAEHLILTSVSDALDHSNGTTEAFRVTFTLRGTPADASRFLRDVCRAIGSPPLRRMHEEANVLRTEGAGRGTMGMGMRLTWYRTGYQGLGTLSLPELFLRNLDESVLRRWVAEHLVAGNAAIWIAGDLPDDLTVDLPHGPRKPMPEVRWIPGFETPTFVVEEAPGVGASFFVGRSTATTTALRTLDRHLKRALRVDRGLAYDVGGDYVPVGPDHAIATVWATCLPNAVRDVERVLLETIDDVAARGPTDDELAEQYERLALEVSDPMAIPGRLDAHVRDVLLGGDPTPMAQLVDEQWRIRSDEVAEAFRQARESMLLLLTPTGTRPQRAFKRYPGTTLGPMGRGRTFELLSTKRKVPWAKTPKAKLTVGDEGVSVDVSTKSRLVGVLWKDCVAVIQGRDVRNIVARDGTIATIVGGEWKDGGYALKDIDRLAPRDTIVPPDH